MRNEVEVSWLMNSTLALATEARPMCKLTPKLNH